MDGGGGQYDQVESKDKAHFTTQWEIGNGVWGEEGRGAL